MPSRSVAEQVTAPTGRARGRARGRPGLIRGVLAVAAISSVLLGTLHHGAAAQELRGIRAFVTFDQRFELSRNRALADPADGSSMRGVSRLGLRLQSETRTQQFRLETGTSFTYGRDPRVSLPEWSDPRLALSYSREGADSLFTFSGSIQRSRFDFDRPLSDFIDEDGELVLPEDFDDLTATGRRVTYNLQSRLELGREAAPFGLTLRAGASGIDYSVPTVNDQRRHNLGATARMRLSPVTSLFLTADHDRFRRDDVLATDRRTNAISLGVTHDLDPVSRVNFAIGHTRIDTRILGFNFRSSGTTGQLGFARAAPDGTFNAGLTVGRVPAGTRSTLQFSRDWERPTGALGGSIGATRAPNGDSNLIGSLTFREDLPNGRFTARVERSVTTDVDDNERLRTSINVVWAQDLTDISRFSLRLTHARSNSTPTAVRVSRTDIGATYSRDLTPDWALNTGVTYRLRSDGTGASARSPVIFIGLGTTFETRL